MFSNENHEIYDEEKLADPPGSSSSLAAIFETGKTQRANARDVSLSYTAPRQPKLFLHQNVDPQKKVTSSVVFCAKTITLISQSSIDSSSFYGSNGRLGIALIGNEHLQTYELILYKDKQNIIHRIKINSTFSLYIDNNRNRVSFNVEKNILLGLEFQNELDCKEFSACVKMKGGQNFYEEPITESTLNVYHGVKTNTEDNKLEASEIAKSREIIEKKTICLYTSKEDLDINDIAPQHTPNPNVRNRLPNEAFGVLFNTNKAQPLQNQGQLQRFPYCYNARPMSDINATYGPNNNNTSMSDNLNTFMVENRSHSCEMRLHMLHLSSKLDTLLRDVSDIKTQTIIKQNAVNCDSKLFNSTVSVTQELELAINKLNQENDELENHLHETDQDKVILVRLNTENTKLRCDIDGKDEDINKMGLEINNLNQKVFRLQEMVATKQEQINSLQSEIRDLSEISQIQSKKLSDVERNKKEEQEHRKILDSMLEVSVKETMNKLYQNILNTFDNMSKYTVRQIEVAVASNLRKASYDMVENVKSTIKLSKNSIAK